MICPYCHGTINDSAQKCQHCGEWVVARPSAPPPPAPPPGYAVPQRVVMAPPQESVAFAVVTLVLYFLVWPLAALLNVIGLLTGPRRGCFLWMFLVFLVLPLVVIFIVLGLSWDEIAREFEKATR